MRMHAARTGLNAPAEGGSARGRKAGLHFFWSNFPATLLHPFFPPQPLICTFSPGTFSYLLLPLLLFLSTRVLEPLLLVALHCCCCGLFRFSLQARRFSFP